MRMGDREDGEDGLIAAPRKVAASSISYALSSKQARTALARPHPQQFYARCCRPVFFAGV